MAILDFHPPSPAEEHWLNEWTHRECYEFYVQQRRRHCKFQQLLDLWLRAPYCESCALSDPLYQRRAPDISPATWPLDALLALGPDTLAVIEAERKDDPDYLLCKRCGRSLRPWRRDDVWVVEYHLEENYGIPLEIEGRKPSKKVRKLIMSLYDRACFGCGATEDLHIDHVLPQSKGGTAAFRNLQPLCADCGDAKGDSVPDEVEVFCDMHFSRCPSDAYEGMFW